MAAVAEAEAMDVAEPVAEGAEYPCKKFFRSRAHCNPLSHNDAFDYPKSPAAVNWAEYYPLKPGMAVQNLDVGCGYGGLSMALAALAKDELTLALEIRPKVCEFVRRRIEALRVSHKGQYDNVSCMRTNSMLYLPNIVNKGQLKRLFFCFPDPHFKAKNWRRRVVSTALLAEYAYALQDDGLVYTVTDVKELHDWHVAKCSVHPLFEAVDSTEENDPFVKAIVNETEEGMKVARNKGAKYFAVYRKKRPEEISPVKLWPEKA
ncbi:putative methyltransferase-domain-containing protein [Pelagophyceae sp. CCMP2097]|nr:putative methyltransferase-domain-containing protein [Pelagophyceae sp. CCMP2097]